MFCKNGVTIGGFRGPDHVPQQDTNEYLYDAFSVHGLGMKQILIDYNNNYVIKQSIPSKIIKKRTIITYRFVNARFPIPSRLEMLKGGTCCSF